MSSSTSNTTNTTATTNTTTTTTTTTTPKTTTSAVLFDLDVHVIQRYSGEALLQRLLWIANHTTTDPQQDIDLDDHVNHETKKKNATTTTTTAPVEGVRAAAVINSTISNTTNNVVTCVSSNGSKIGTNLSERALRTALTHCMTQGNVQRYKEIYQHLSHTTINHDLTTGSTIPTMDVHWVQETEIQNRHQMNVLQSNLQMAQSHLNKDAVRSAYLALAHYQWQIGETTDAYYAMIRATDYCTNRYQTAQTSLQVLVLALYTKRYAAIRDYIPRVEHTVRMLCQNPNNNTGSSGSSSSNNNNNNSTYRGSASPMEGSIPPSWVATLVTKRLQTISALERLLAGDYVVAATKFSEVARMNTLDHSNNHTIRSSSTSTTATTPSTTINNCLDGFDDWDKSVLCPEDMAVYAAVLTLSHGDRSMAIQLTEHPEAMERAPFLRDVLHQFYQRANYVQAWNILEIYVWPILQYDLFFQQSIDSSKMAINTTTTTTKTTTNSTLSSSSPPPPRTTILSVVQKAIRYKAIGQFWKAYHNCPVHMMAEHLGQGLSGPNLQSTLIEILKHRHPLVPVAGSSHDTAVLLPMNTRFDGRTQTLIREQYDHPFNLDQKRWMDTAQKLSTISTHVMNDTYAMVVRLACLEQGVILTDPSCKRSRGGGGWMGQGGHSSYLQDGGEEIEVEGSEGEEEVGNDEDDDADMIDAVVIGDGINPEDLY